MKKLSLVIAAAAAVLALAGCKNGAQEVAVVESVGFGSNYYYGVTGTATVTTKTETYTATTTYTATDKTLANVTTSSDYNTNQIVYKYNISEIKSKTVSGTTTVSESDNAVFGFTVVKMGGDYYLNVAGASSESAKFAGNSNYIKLEKFSTENLTGTVTYTGKIEGVTATFTVVLNLELSKL